jgi:hypothetical protein
MPWASQIEETIVTETEGRMKPMYLMLVWGFVGIPLVWGVIETLLNALKLFQ